LFEYKKKLKMISVSLCWLFIHKNEEEAKMFMFLKMSYFKIGLIFEKAEPFGNS